MIKRLFYVDTDNTYPYKNLAVEEYLTLHVPEDAVVLFLWQNRQTVVIGRNQNCWLECRVKLLENEGGFLVRRLSGGGAVFHDMGNQNFTFVARDENYSVDRQLQVILNGVRYAGISAEKTGRNDITVDGRKFSGNAFYSSGIFRYHHGTLLICSDKEKMERYLNASGDKMKSKGVSSVRSRVANLCEFEPCLTPEGVKECLIRAFGEVYGLRPERIPVPSDEETAAMTKKFESWKWKYGRNIPFEYEAQRRFSWGEARLRIHADSGIIRDAVIYSDAMDQDIIGNEEECLRGCKFEPDAMCSALEEGAGKNLEGEKKDLAGNIAGDLSVLVRESF